MKKRETVPISALLAAALETPTVARCCDKHVAWGIRPYTLGGWLDYLSCRFGVSRRELLRVIDMRLPVTKKQSDARTSKRQSDARKPIRRSRRKTATA